MNGWRWASGVVAASLTLACTSPAPWALAASPSTQHSSSSAYPIQLQGQRVPIGQAIDVALALLPYLTQDDQGCLHLDAVAAQHRISQSALRAFEQGMFSYNALVAQGYFSRSNGRLTLVKALPNTLESGGVDTSLTGVAQPSTVGITWWGLYDRLTEQQTVELEAALGTASGSAAVIASILGLTGAGAPGALVSGLIGGLLAVGAGEILFVDASGGFRGVTVYYSWFWGFGVYAN